MLVVKASQNDDNIVFVYPQDHPPTIIPIMRNICYIFVALKPEQAMIFMELLLLILLVPNDKFQTEPLR